MTSKLDLSIQVNPQIENSKHEFKQKLLETEVQISQFSQQKHISQKITKSKKFCSAVDLKIDSIYDNKKGNEKNGEQLNKQVEKYQRKCEQLQNQLKETLQTVKFIRNKLSVVNEAKILQNQCKNKQFQQYDNKNKNSQLDINSFVVKNSYIQEDKNEKNQIQISNKSDNLNQPTIQQKFIHLQKQSQKNQKVINQSNLIKNQDEIDYQKKTKVLYTIKPIIISSSSPRIIRLGKDKSYCTRGCNTYCTCLCPSIMTKTSE